MFADRKFWLDSSLHLQSALQPGRDYHLDTMKPGYTAYTYPHPERIDWRGIPSE